MDDFLPPSLRTDASPLEPWAPASLGHIPEDQLSLLTIEDVQKYLNRSRASVYRYANTNPELLNSPYDPQKLNPELRRDKDDPLQFRPQEVQRFGEEVLGLKPTIQVQTPTETVTNALLQQILQELKQIHSLLKAQQSLED
ncbi:MAG: resolvase [Cyanobacteriota bacterium]|nr:resolvase [Cyanobacteriota bacterium]